MQRLNIGDLNRKKRKKPLFASVVFLCFVAVLFFLPGKISNSLYWVSVPLQKSLGSLSDGASFITSPFLDSGKLKEENEKLRDERQKLIAEIFLLKELERENERLREALEIDIDEDFNFVLAGVSGMNLKEDLFLIDKGLKDGIAVGMPVITSKRVAVGRVYEVYDNFSKIMLVTHKDNSFFDAYIHGAETIGIVKGEGGFRLSLDLLSKESEIEKGMGAVTMGEVFPRKIFIGVVNEIVKTDAEPFQKASIRPLFNPRTLESVFIITNYQK